MQCDSCGRPVAADSTACGQCGESVGNGGDVSRSSAAGTRDGRALVTDGGQGPPDDEDDPLADTSGDSGAEQDDEYLGAGDIVEDEAGDEPPAGRPDDQPPAGQPQGGQPDNQPPAGQPQGGQPNDQPPAGQPQGGQPNDQPPAGQPPAGQPQGGQPNDQPPAGQPQGGQPNDQPPAGQPQGGQPNDQPPAGQPQGGQPNDQPPAGQPQGGQPAGAQGAGQPGQQGQPGQPAQAPAGAGGQGAPTGEAGAPLGGEGVQEHAEETTLVDELKRYPLKLGTALGTLAFLIPYGLLTLATFWAWEQPPGENYQPLVGDRGWQAVDGAASWSELDVSAELFFYVAELGSGEAIVDLFRRSAGVARPEEVDPSDYPTAEEQLDPLLDLIALDAVPEVPLLILFMLAPYVLFLSSRYLARHYTPGDEPFEYAIAGATVTIGTLIVSLLLGLIFPVTNFAGRLLFAGIIVPGLIGAVGGLSIWAFDDHSALVSSLTGWTVMALGIGVGVVLLPLPDVGDVTLNLSILERLVLALGAYLNAAQFNIGSHGMGRLFFLIVVLLTIGAGFFRTWQARDVVADRMDGARVGASIFLGFLATIALFLWAFPMATVLVDVALVGDPQGLWFAAIEAEAVESGGSFGGGVPVATILSVTGVESFFRAIFVAGLVFPMTFGGIGGYLAVWYRDR